MSNSLSTALPRTDNSKLPLWLIVAVSALVVFALSTAAVLVYKKSKPTPEFISEQAQLETRQQWLLYQDDVIDTNLLRTLNPLVEKVKGRLIWSSALQQGIIEFENLPAIAKDQIYRLWIYDLDRQDNKPQSAFELQVVKESDFKLGFRPQSKISNPLKFELVLETQGRNDSQPLLLAQP